MTARAFLPACLAGIALSLVAFTPKQPAPPVAPSLYSGLQWRNVGPFRAGRVTAVTGAIGDAGVFYMGLPIGGVWKTTSAGVTWFPIFDDIKEVSSIGSVEVAPSDPNIVYVGSGSVNEGNGVYKSMDAGQTWTHLGMDRTRVIPQMLVDPKNPDVVIMAALGTTRAPDADRGVFRSTDGGKSWTKTLFVDDMTGAQALGWAFDHPEVILASTIRRGGGRGAAGGGAVGGAAGATTTGGGAAGAAGAAPGTAPVSNGTGLYRSTDEGVTWKEIKGGGLPTLSGRISVAVAMHSNAQRMYIIGPTAIGFWRSDDGGDTWRRLSALDDRITNGQGNYTSGVWVDTKNPDIVYTTATTLYKSINGGVSFTGFKGSPGGDDPQTMWLDPMDSKRMFLGGDQGASVSQDAGANWSLWYNQPTEQIYHISVDNQYPYWIYGTQQDACAIQVRSRGDLGEVTWMDWSPNPGFERGSIVADPLNPKIIYALNMTAGIMKITNPSGQWINVAPNMDSTLALRSNGDQPLAFNAANPHELLAGYQYLMSTTDAGMHWAKLGGDLTFTTAIPAPVPGAGGGGAGGGSAGSGVANASITTIATSHVVAGTMWVGTTNGVIKVTKNHGVTWSDVSVPNVRGSISAIDASHFDAATAYVALRPAGDFTPYLYRTHDYGRTWTKIVNGLPTDQVSGSFARVIRNDTKKQGLLFAGTESSMYVSFDDGDSWQSLMLNLPNTSYRDIVVKDNDVVVATYGRSIWILDDISPLRQMSPAIASEPAHLFKPGDAIRVRRDVNGDTPFPPEIPHAKNPPLGAVIYYYLGSKPSRDVTLEVSDAAGRVVRHMSSAPIPPITDPPAPVPDWWLEVPQPMPTTVGTNRINWNLRYDNPPAFNHNYAQVMGGIPGETPYTPEGPIALPGVYTVKLVVDGQTYTQTVTVKNDPRSPASAADLRAQHDLQMKLYDGAKLAWDGWHRVDAMRTAVAQSARGHAGEVAAAAASLDSALARVGGSSAIVPANRPRVIGAVPSFAGLNGTEPGESSVLLSMNGQLRTQDYGDMAPPAAAQRAWVTACTDLRTVVQAYNVVVTRELPAFNATLARNNVAVVPAGALLVAPACGAVASMR